MTHIELKVGDTMTRELLLALREEAKSYGDTTVEMLTHYIEAQRADHETRLLFGRLLGKTTFAFVKLMRSFEFLTDPDTIARRMFLGCIDNFDEAWRGILTDEPATFESTNVERTFSEDGTSMHVRYVHWTAGVVGAMLAESLLRPEGDPDPSPYFNNVTMTMTHMGRKFAVTVQNLEDGKTPQEQRAEAEAERDRARVAAEILRNFILEMRDGVAKDGAGDHVLESTAWLDATKKDGE